MVGKHVDTDQFMTLMMEGENVAEEYERFRNDAKGTQIYPPGIPILCVQSTRVTEIRRMPASFEPDRP